MANSGCIQVTGPIMAYFHQAGGRCVLILGVAFALVVGTDTAAHAQVPPGFELIRITNDEDQDGQASINECGQIVFSKRIDQDWDLEEIFLYDNGRTTRLTYNTVHDWLPIINNNSTIIWWHRISEFDTYIWMHQDGETVELFPSASGGHMNDLGQIAFIRYGDPTCRGPEIDLYFFDGEEIVPIQMGDNERDAHQSPEVNNAGDIAWTGYDFCSNPWESDIMAWIDGKVVQITRDRFEPQSAAINNAGVIAWSWLLRNEECSHVIELWADGKIERFPGCARFPHMNDLGDLGFVRRLPGGNVGAIYYNDTQSEYHLRFESANVGIQELNNWGEAAISLVFGLPHVDTAILRRIRTGDSEFDGDVDHDDLAKLVDCMTGPMWVERTDPGPEDSLCECRFLDINHDGSVDLRDYAIFQQNFGQ